MCMTTAISVDNFGKWGDRPAEMVPICDDPCEGLMCPEKSITNGPRLSLFPKSPPYYKKCGCACIVAKPRLSPYTLNSNNYVDMDQDEESVDSINIELQTKYMHSPKPPLLSMGQKQRLLQQLQQDYSPKESHSLPSKETQEGDTTSIGHEGASIMRRRHAFSSFSTMSGVDSEHLVNLKPRIVPSPASIMPEAEPFGVTIMSRSRPIPYIEPTPKEETPSGPHLESASSKDLENIKHSQVYSRQLMPEDVVGNTGANFSSMLMRFGSVVPDNSVPTKFAIGEPAMTIDEQTITQSTISINKAEAYTGTFGASHNDRSKVGPFPSLMVHLHENSIQDELIKTNYTMQQQQQQQENHVEQATFQFLRLKLRSLQKEHQKIQPNLKQAHVTLKDAFGKLRAMQLVGGEGALPEQLTQLYQEEKQARTAFETFNSLLETNQKEQQSVIRQLKGL